MIYYVYALENNKSRMCVKRMQTNDKMTAECVADIWESEGYIINIIRSEEC